MEREVETNLVADEERTRDIWDVPVYGGIFEKRLDVMSGLVPSKGTSGI